MFEKRTSFQVAVSAIGSKIPVTEPIIKGASYVMNVYLAKWSLPTNNNFGRESSRATPLTPFSLNFLL